MSSADAKSPLRIALIGAAGRMGQAIEACAHREPAAFEIVGRAGRNDDLATVEACEVVIDFSTPAATERVLAACRMARKGLVLGTTGHSVNERAAIAGAARTEIPVVFASNFSVGVNTLFWLTRQAARILGPAFDLEVIEVHHRLKKDSPSGTARRLVEILAEARGLDESSARHGREGLVGARTAAEIGVHAVRGGDVVGDHTVLFADAGERVELTHRASSRETFAMGALRAAGWLVGRSPALYDMEDVLDLRAEPAAQS